MSFKGIIKKQNLQKVLIFKILEKDNAYKNAVVRFIEKKELLNFFERDNILRLLIKMSFQRRVRFYLTQKMF